MTLNMNEIGSRSALCYCIVSFAALCGSPITGALVRGTDFTRSACFSGGEAAYPKSLVWWYGRLTAITFLSFLSGDFSGLLQRSCCQTFSGQEDGNMEDVVLEEEDRICA